MTEPDYTSRPWIVRYRYHGILTERYHQTRSEALDQVAMLKKFPLAQDIELIDRSAMQSPIVGKVAAQQ